MTTDASVSNHEAVRLSVTGVVQGVGFRPFVHRLALNHGLCGWVRNEAGAVRIVVEGSNDTIQAFVEALRADAPSLARIDSITTHKSTPKFPEEFQIVSSTDRADRRSPVAPDVALCEACLAELNDPTNRRYRYPFITCTDCGPRFTVIEAMPYDRERTSMRLFPQCADCHREYETPRDRRYHSESNSCPQCGPSVWLESAGDESIELRGLDSIEEAARLLCTGKILAVRGLGGFHLAVDATNDSAVRRLRKRKSRETKPLAIMVRSLEQAKQIAAISEAHEGMLLSLERPIVLLDPKNKIGLAPSIAPGIDTIGVMIAYTPLHYLLLELVDRPLVMTSGNRSDEPITIDNVDARQSLDRIADAFLLHDRNIVARADDSVVRCANAQPLFLRRARGYAPLPVVLPVAAPQPLLAVGPHLKNTFTLVHEDRAYVSQHIGNLENLETIEQFERSLSLLKELFRIEPTAVAHDLHPEYLSTRIAKDMDLPAKYSVQHHHAHIAAVIAEHGLSEQVIGFAYDGTGYGDDGAVWGAETLVADLTGYQRVCQLRYAPLPGGDVAVHQAWRVALGYLSLEPSVAGSFSRAFHGIDDATVALVQKQIERNLNTPNASSMGRLFDAAAAVLGTRQVSSHEGQAAMELEALAGSQPAKPLPFPILESSSGSWTLDPLPLLVALGDLRAAGDDVAGLAARFHESIAAATVSVANLVSSATNIRTVALGGGVFQNARLLETINGKLESRGFTVLLPHRLSPNDGAISYGQAAVAASLMRKRGAECFHTG